MKAIVSALVLVASAAAAARAQTKQEMLDDWARQRANVLAYVDAMPDSAMVFRPTPGVRDFAQQIEHAVSTDLEVAAMALRGLSAPPFSLDTTQMHQKVVLRAYADRTFAYVLESIRLATPAQLLKQSVLYGQPQQSAARWLALAYEHAVWTLGQTVPYLRLNGVTPPAYRQPL